MPFTVTIERHIGHETKLEEYDDVVDLMSPRGFPKVRLEFEDGRMETAQLGDIINIQDQDHD